MTRLAACLATVASILVGAVNADPDYSGWVFSSDNNAASPFDTFGGPNLVYNSVGVPAENISSVYPHLYPYKEDELVQQISDQLRAIYADGEFAGNNSCSKCQTALLMGKTLAMARPEAFPGYMQELCNVATNSGQAWCEAEYSANPGRGLNNAEVFQKFLFETGDMTYYCRNRLGVSSCPYPAAIPINGSEWFTSPKPENATAPPPSGKTFKAIHFSDWHLDPRYSTGSEANCTTAAPCCRSNNYNADSPDTPMQPASRFGDYACDVPADMGLSVFKHMREVLNFTEVELALFTGDLISHDSHWELSDAYTTYTEVMSYLTFKAQLGDMPLYVALGNHDSNPTDMSAPSNWYTGSEVNDFAWNNNLVASLWAANGWISGDTPESVRAHNGAYSVVTQQGKLRVITYNTDFWFWTNIYNYVNVTDPDPTGMFKWMIEELEAAEQAGQRVWLVGHVESGYAGGDAMPNPTSLFYEIVQRFSPHVISGIFYGHTHADYGMVYYDSPVRGDLPLKNQTDVELNGINFGWIVPSITPLWNGNPSWRYYDVDSETFEIINSYTYFSNISDTSNWTEPVWQFEYSARESYDDGSWPADAPLNGTWWANVVERMSRNESELVQNYNNYINRLSPYTTNCTSWSCINETICYMQSGSSVQGLACGGTYLGL